jgi:choline-phosphate cytidylyltransferase
MRSRQVNRDGHHGSDSSEEDSEERSPRRGRSGKADISSHDEASCPIDSSMNENSEILA